MAIAAEPLEKLPHWDLSNVYSGLEAEDYQRDFARLQQSLSDLERLFDAQNIRRLADSPPPLRQPGAELSELLATVLEQVNQLSRLAETLSSYVYAFYSTDSYNAIAAREVSKLELLGVRRSQLAVRLQGWIGSLAPRLGDWIAGNRLLADHSFFLHDSARRSRYLMSEELEHLAAELCVDAGGAFGKLQGTVTSQLKVPLEREGRTENRADHGCAQLRFRSRSGLARARLSGRTARLGIDSQHRGRLPERRQGNGAHAGPPPGLAERARLVARCKPDRPRDARRHAGRHPRSVSDVSWLLAGQSPKAGTAAAALVGLVCAARGPAAI